ncbi:hypothetical protein VNI00_006997 [Paramarasmius palmivorus]|uniref:Uncharacterized protein n=1 Tax=Paramarasmius palmivorus TaxID=297713 RepID=A0AAW0D2R3_9AGAR
MSDYNATRNSAAVRQSVLDVFTQLGGLKENSLLSQWMFEEGEGAFNVGDDGRDVEEKEQEKEIAPDNSERGMRMSPMEERMFYDRQEAEVMSPAPRGRLQNVKAKLSAKFLTLRSRSKSKSKKHGTHTPEERTSLESGSVTTTKSAHSTFSLPSRRKGPAIRTDNSNPITISLPDRDACSEDSPQDDASTLPEPQRSRRADTALRGKGSIIRSKGNPTADTVVQRKMAGRDDADQTISNRNPKMPSLLPSHSAQSIHSPRKPTEKKDRRPPDLAPIVVKPSVARREHRRMVSRSLPPSPFILVSPQPWEHQDDGVEVTTPFILSPAVNLPIQDKEDVETTPMIPVSISKTLRKSFLHDELQPAPFIANGRAHGVDSSERRMRRATLQTTNPTTTMKGVSILAPSAPRPLQRSSSLRGRESPFPTRPIRPLPLSLAIQGVDAAGIRLSLDARASVLRQRYQGRYETHLSRN